MLYVYPQQSVRTASKCHICMSLSLSWELYRTCEISKEMSVNITCSRSGVRKCTTCEISDIGIRIRIRKCHNVLELGN